MQQMPQTLFTQQTLKSDKPFKEQNMEAWSFTWITGYAIYRVAIRVLAYWVVHLVGYVVYRVCCLYRVYHLFRLKDLSKYLLH